MHSTIHGWLTITLCILALQHCCDWNFDKELNLIVTTLYSNIWSAMNIPLGHNSWSYRSKLSDWHTQIRCQVSSFPLYLVYSGWSRHVVINVPTTAGLHCCNRYEFHWSTDLTPSCFATAIWPLLLNTRQWLADDTFRVSAAPSYHSRLMWLLYSVTCHCILAWSQHNMTNWPLHYFEYNISLLLGSAKTYTNKLWMLHWHILVFTKIGDTVQNQLFS